MRKLLFIIFSIIFLTSITKSSVGQYYRDSVDENDYEADDDYDYNNDDEEIVDTTLQYNNLSISQDHINTLKNSKDFSYIKTLDSLLKEQKKNKKKPKEYKVKFSFFDKLFSSPILKIILWSIGILFVLFILYKLFLADGLFKKPSARIKVSQPELEEVGLNDDTDFDLMISNALRDNNYRLAVRYNYLKTLYVLSKNNLVQIAPDKTNYQYVREINNAQYQNIFSALTLNYEYVWYGEFSIDQNIYKKIEGEFMKFNKNFN